MKDIREYYDKFALQYLERVAGLDISPKMAELFRIRNPDSECVVGDLINTDYLANIFDAFLSSFSPLHFDDDELKSRLKEISRIVKRHADGLIVAGSVDDQLEVS